MICRAGASPAIDSASGALALQFQRVSRQQSDAGARRLHADGPPWVDKRAESRSAIHDVQCSFLYIERRLSHSLAQRRVRMSGAPDVLGAAAEFDH